MIIACLCDSGGQFIKGNVYYKVHDTSDCLMVYILQVNNVDG